MRPALPWFTGIFCGAWLGGIGSVTLIKSIYWLCGARLEPATVAFVGCAFAAMGVIAGLTVVGFTLEERA